MNLSEKTDKVQWLLLAAGWNEVSSDIRTFDYGTKDGFSLVSSQYKTTSKTKHNKAQCLTFAVGWNTIPHGYRQARSHPGAHQLEAWITSEGALCVDGGAILGTLQSPIVWGTETLA